MRRAGFLPARLYLMHRVWGHPPQDFGTPIVLQGPAQPFILQVPSSAPSVVTLTATSPLGGKSQGIALLKRLFFSFKMCCAWQGVGGRNGGGALGEKEPPKFHLAACRAGWALISTCAWVAFFWLCLQHVAGRSPVPGASTQKSHNGGGSEHKENCHPPGRERQGKKMHAGPGRTQ